MLTIETEHTLHCPRCTQLSITIGAPDPSHGVNPPDDTASQLTDLIRASFATETVQGVTCSNADCRDHSDRPRSHSITGAPDILCIQLRRFIYRVSASGTANVRKNNQRVLFGPRIDLSAYLAGRKLEPRTVQYRLVAVVHQMGGLNTGHYITVARGPNGKWRELDDAIVARAVLADATDPQKSGQRAGYVTPYLLFWERVDTVVADI